MPATANRLNAKDRSRLNAQLCDLCAVRHDALPIGRISELLATIGVSFEPAIYCGREARCTIPLFRDGQELDNSILMLYWYKSDTTGTYEVNAYLS